MTYSGLGQHTHIQRRPDSFVAVRRPSEPSTSAHTVVDAEPEMQHATGTPTDDTGRFHGHRKPISLRIPSRGAIPYPGSPRKRDAGAAPALGSLRAESGAARFRSRKQFPAARLGYAPIQRPTDQLTRAGKVRRA